MKLFVLKLPSRGAGMQERLHGRDSVVASIQAPAHEPVKWRCAWRIDKRWGDWTDADILKGIAPKPFETIFGEGNALTGIGVNDLFTGLCTAGLATPYTTANAQLAVGDSSTAAAVSDTDMDAAQQAAVGGGLSSPGASNASPIVITTASAHGLVAGQAVVIAGVGGNTAANGTWEVAASPAPTSTTFALLNSTGNGAWTSGGTVNPINKYRQAITSVTVNPAVGGGVTGVTNVTNPTITTSTAHGLAVGQIVQIAAVGGATGVNGTWKVATVPTSTTFTITAAAPGVYTSGGAVNLLGGVQFAGTFGPNNANHAWNEFGTTTGGAATNKQATPPPHLLNRAVAANGTKASGQSWTLTETLSAS